MILWRICCLVGLVCHVINLTAAIITKEGSLGLDWQATVVMSAFFVSICALAVVLSDD